MADEHLTLNPELILSAQDIDDVVSQFRLRTSDRRLSHQQMQRFFNDLPKMTEADLIVSGHQDDVCPICFNTFLATLAEEEMAQAMDSPAHPIEELGVTKLQNTCGHLFCRKDIMKWIIEGHDSCPSCRRPLLTDRQEGGSLSPTQPPNSLGEGWLRNWVVESNMVARDTELPIIALDPFHALGTAEGRRHRHDDQNQFAGMYS